MNRAFVIAVALAAASSTAPSFAGQGLPVAEDLPPAPGPCIPPLASTPARCTFNVYGVVRDVHGIKVRDAVVSDGGQRTTSDVRGFYDLFKAAPGTHRITVRISPACSVTLSVNVDPAAAMQSGGARRDIRMPCERPTYNAFGFGVVQKGKLVTYARSSTNHVGDAGGIEQYGLLADGSRELPLPVADTDEDDRDAAGGLTRSGALVVFYTRYRSDLNRWTKIGYVRMSKDGTRTGTIHAGENRAFAPHGPIVILPSGRLMQTFYGYDGATWRIYTAFSSDDGLTWSRLVPIDSWPSFRATEAAAVYLDGATDDRARILLVARASGGRRSNHWSALMQYLSNDGGRSWIRQGAIPSTRSRYEGIPWMAALEGGRLALVWADRGTMTLKRSITPFAEAVAGRWRGSSVVYRSAVLGSRYSDIGDFGYPSIVSYGPRDDQKAIVFNDLDPAGSVGWLKDIDLYVLPLWAGPSVKPVALSP